MLAYFNMRDLGECLYEIMSEPRNGHVPKLFYRHSSFSKLIYYIVTYPFYSFRIMIDISQLIKVHLFAIVTGFLAVF